MNWSALFSVRGREARLRYWRLQLLIDVLAALVWCGGLFAMIGLGPWAAILFLAFGPLVAMTVALVIRRVHDRGKSAIWALIFVFGPLALEAPLRAQAGVEGQSPALSTLGLALGGAALSIWGFVEIGLRRGTKGPNRYGPDPRA